MLTIWVWSLSQRPLFAKLPVMVAVTMTWLLGTSFKVPGFVLKLSSFIIIADKWKFGDTLLSGKNASQKF